MRTTITLDAEAEELVRRLMRERNLSFKEAVNHAIVAGLRPRRTARAFRTPTFDLGGSAVSLDRAVALAAELENEELMRKSALGK